jgi:hypothetical protein
VDLAGPVQFAIDSRDLQALRERWTGSE